MKSEGQKRKTWVLSSILLFSGCAGYMPAVPQGQGQSADRNGPVTVHIYQGVQSFGGGRPRKLAERITVTITAPASADGSVQGSATQTASQEGSELGPVTQEPTGTLEIPIIP